MFVTYEFKNIINGNRYIGSSSKYEARCKRHLKDLSKNKHHSLYLQRAYNLYGQNSFVFNILDYHQNTDEMKKAEQSLLDQGFCEYNTSKFSSGGDNISNHPNHKHICEKKRLEYQHQILINNGKHPSKINISFKGELNNNWQGGKSKHTCCDCEAIIPSYQKRCMGCNKNYLKIIRKGEGNNFYGKYHTEETLQKIRNTKSKLELKLPSNTRQVLIEGVIYESCTAAGKVLGVTTPMILYRIKSTKYPEYNYVSHPSISAPISV